MCKIPKCQKESKSKSCAKLISLCHDFWRQGILTCEHNLLGLSYVSLRCVHTDSLTFHLPQCTYYIGKYALLPPKIQNLITAKKFSFLGQNYFWKVPFHLLGLNLEVQVLFLAMLVALHFTPVSE